MKAEKTSVEYSNPYFDIIKKVFKSEAGKEYYYYMLEAPHDFVVVIAKKGDKILMTNQFRVPINCKSNEFVGGFINEGERFEDAAIRELREEGGYIANVVTYMGKICPAVGKSSSRGYLYLATCLEQTETDYDEFETFVGLESFWKSEDEIGEMIRNGEIIDSATLAAWCIYMEGDL